MCVWRVFVYVGRLQLCVVESYSSIMHYSLSSVPIVSIVQLLVVIQHCQLLSNIYYMSLNHRGFASYRMLKTKSYLLFIILFKCHKKIVTTLVVDVFLLMYFFVLGANCLAFRNIV